MQGENFVHERYSLHEQLKAPSTTRKRTILLSVALGLALVLCVLTVCIFLPHQPNDAAREMMNGDFKNHYRVDNGTVRITQDSVNFMLVRDEKPNFEGDIVQPTADNPELSHLNVSIVTESDHRLHIVIKDAHSPRWRVPFSTEETVLDPQDELLAFQRYHIRETGLRWDIPRFSLTLSDRDKDPSQPPILTTADSYFRFMDKYLALELRLQATRLLGLGEHVGNVSLRNGTYTLFTRDQGTPVETRTHPGKNLYGMHPFVLFQQPDGLFAGLYLKTSNALEVAVRLDEAEGTRLRFTTVGGILELYVLYKGSAQYILRQYHQVIGKPALPPLWALGYHHGKTGFKSLEEVRALVQNFSANGLPLDGLWVDFDILQLGRNFIVNNQSFAGLKSFVEELRRQHVHFVPVLEPGLKADDEYVYFTEARDIRGLAKNESGDPVRGKTHVGFVGYPNFHHPGMWRLWQNGVHAFVNATGLDGLWLNLNEFSSQCDGDCASSASSGPYDHLPFVPGATPLNTSTLSMTADYSPNPNKLDPIMCEFNIHSTNCILMANCTREALEREQPTRRTFMVSRSTFPGIQKYAVGHWFGETESTWAQLRASLAGITNFQMLGVPLSAPSICGYKGNANEELCVRWMQLAAMYPLSLNLNAADASSQDPWAFSGRALGTYRNAIRTRYSLLRFLYTAVFEQALRGGTAIQPLFFEFPNDELAYRTSDRVMLIGSGLLVAPPLQPQLSLYSVYLPNANWFAFPSGRRVLGYDENRTEGVTIQAEVSQELPTLFVRGGTVLPYQDAIGLKVRNVEELVETPLTLFIALDENRRAVGRMIVDDGISADTIAKKKYRHYSFTFSHKALKVQLLEGHNTSNEAPTPSESFSNLQIWGAGSLQNVSSACVMTSVMSRRGIKVEYNSATDILTVYDPSRRKLQWRAIETIALFADDDYNYCLGGFVATKIKITDQLRRMSALLETALDLSERKYQMDAILLNNYVLNLKISPTSWQAWEVPGVVDVSSRNQTLGKTAFAEYLFAISTDPDPFFFAVANPGDPDDTTITTQNLPIVLNEHFIEVSTLLKATHVYGLGERVQQNFSLGSGRYTLYTRDAISPIEDGEAPGKNMYGSHPFYMFRTPDGAFAGVFFLNSNAMDISILPFDEETYQVDHISTGGLIDMFIIQRGPPKTIIEQYYGLIGKPHLLPYWAFGHHQCRYGYRSEKQLREVVANYAKAGLPLDALWTDIDYMRALVPFTLDHERYPSMRQFVAELHSQRIHFVPIIEAAIAVNPPNEAYRRGLEADVFIGRGTADGSFSKYKHVLGMVWPGYSTFVDFLHPRATEYWVDMLEYFAENLFPFDGIWLDMNEIASFCDGECNLNGDQRRPFEVGNSRFDDLPYIPGHRNLQRMTLPSDAQHFSGGSDRALYVEHNLHSLFGHLEIRATHAYFLKHDIRPFIISRSTFAGSGRYASHWLGDNKSQWPFLRYSIIGLYNFNMFGIPFTGADVCGFVGNTTTELCQRWYQLAAFYPFCRNHNDVNTVDQEPYTNEALRETAHSALQLRYGLIRYLYTLHMHSALNGGPYFMPVFFEFPEDPQALQNPELTFMFGPAIKVTPVLQPGALNVTSYFPNANWFELQTGKQAVKYKEGSKVGVTLTLDAALARNVINAHVRGGHILPIQDTVHRPVLNTHELRALETGFIIAPDSRDRAEGLVLFDDESASALQTGAYHLFNLTYSKGKLSIEYLPRHTQRKLHNGVITDENLGEVQLFGAKVYKDVIYACAVLHNNQRVRLDAIYDTKNDKLIMKALDVIDILDIHSIVWQDDHIIC